jgi:phage shock protein A
MGLIRLVIFLLLVMACNPCKAQTDSAIESLQKLPVQYINQLDNKIDKYSNRISSKTEKTLQKLARWENKIRVMVEKVDPDAAQRLFSGQTTFAILLQKLQEGKTIAENYTTKYDEYRDKLRTSMSYLQQQKDDIKGKLVKPVTEVSQQLTKLDNNIKNSEALEQFIKERKKILLDQCIQYIGKSKYLNKISAESYYYVETLRNYKSLFTDKRKAEQTALTILSKIPKFNQFVQENSMLASLFGSPSSNGGGTVASLAGLQTRASVTALIQNQIAAGGPNAQQQIQQNIQAAQSELNKLKDKVLQAGGSSGDMEITEGKLNPQKTKTFLQRITVGTDASFTKNSALLPSVANLALSAAYKFSDKKEMGIAIAYRAGLGSINRIQITHQGLSFRSFASIKFKKNFWITGGWEANQNAGFKNIEQLKQYNQWQQSMLAGIEKKINIKTKWFKGTSLKLLYDALAYKHTPVSQPVVFRVGYNF